MLGGPKNWSSGFLPASYQGTLFRREGAPILDLAPPKTIGDEQQRGRLDLLRTLNRHFGDGRPDDTELEARLNSYELAYRMQSAAPEAVDLTKESEATRKLYGMDNEVTAKFGANCLLARRLVERGVRFVELYSGSGSGWDAHNDLDKNHGRRCQETDVPIAGLLTDLKARGLLDSTLVVWGGEFGRTPFNEKGNGPRPQSLGLHHVDGRRRHQEGPHHRAHRRYRPARRGASRCTCTISTPPFSGAWAWTT